MLIGVWVNPMTSDSKDQGKLETTRRTFMAGSAATLGAGMSEGHSSVAEFLNSEERPDPEENPRLFADRILLNGKVVTLDENEMNDDPGTIAEAMAIKDGRILDLGDGERIKKWRGPKTEVVNLNGKTVLPGIVESHVHPSGTIEGVAPDLFDVAGLHMALRAEATPEATKEKMRDFMEMVEPEEGEWIFMNVVPNPDIPEVDSILKITSWIKTETEEEQKIKKDFINELAPNNPMLTGLSGGRTPSVAEAGQIIRITRSEGEINREVIKE